MTITPAYPEQAPIDSYGGGGFRFAGMSHRGALLLLPSGIFGWSPGDPEALQPDDFDRVFQERGAIAFLMLGTGQTQVFPSADIRRLFSERGLGLEVMDTGAVCRAYNVLLSEKRAVAAAVIAVE